MRLSLGALLIILAVAGGVSAEMGAVSTDLAEIRDAPSISMSFATFLVPRHYPLYIHDAQGDFYLVSDYLNNSGWINKGDMDRTRTIVVNSKSAVIRSAPGPDSPVLFTAQEGVSFKVTSADGAWLQVEHESGMSGWLARTFVWGD